MLRRALELATRSLRYRRTLRFGGASIPLYISPSAGLRYLIKPMANIDPGLLRLVKSYVRPGDTVWDVGANVGLFTFASSVIAGASGRVVAFEADDWLVEGLRKSIALQRDSNIEVIYAAVAQSCGTRRFSLAVRSRATNHLEGYGSTQTGGTRAVKTVPAISLDSLDRPPPDLLKIDVEGAEAEVLRGASRVLASRPTVICEVSSAVAEEVTSLLRGHGYDLFNGETGAATEQATWSTVARHPLRG